MSDEFRAANERRAFVRLPLKVPVELHQGGSVWELELIDISLTGLAVSEPDDWDADYSHPFNFIIRLPDSSTLEVYAHLVHLDPGHMGFEMEHLDDEQLAPLAKLLAAELGEDQIGEELAILEASRQT